MNTIKLCEHNKLKKEIIKLFDQNVKLKYENLSFDRQKKIDFISALQHVNCECVYKIIKFTEKGDSTIIPILSRTVFENGVIMILISFETLQNGLNRYFLFNRFNEYKQYQQHKNIIGGNANLYYSEEELRTYKRSYDLYKKKYKNTSDWFGMNLSDVCKYIDKNYGSMWNKNDVFSKMYINSYSLLSKSVHGQKKSTDNVRAIKLKYIFKKWIVMDSNRNHEVIFLYFTKYFFIASLVAIYNILDDQVKLKTYTKMLSEFEFTITSFEKREEIRKTLNIKKKKL